jgi:hypothetical protein
MTMLSEKQLTEYEELINRSTPVGAATASPGMAAALLAEVKQLRERDAKLNALEAYGVDNWDGYDEAVQSLEEEN